MRFSLRILGGASLHGAGGPVGGRAAHKRRLALLAILAAARGRPVARERILGLLWPDSPSAAARHLLSESLTVLRRELGDDAFVSRGDELILDPGVVSSDLDAFEAAVEQGDAAGAVALYPGPLLDGFYVADAPEFERWAEEVRDRVARAYAGVLEGLAEECERRGDPRAGADWWRRLAASDRYSSRVALRLMSALEAAGEREAALRHAAVHAALLREELGTEPSAELRALTAQLRQAPPPVIAPAASAEAPRIEQADDTVSGDEDGTVAEARPESAEPAIAVAAPPAEAAPGARHDAAVWFADVAGYAALREHDPAAARELLDALRELARREVRRAGGHVVGEIGHGVLAEFPDPAACARSAGRLLRAFERRARQAGAPTTLRVGAHAGAVAVADDGGMYGDPVSLAARLQERAEAGQVLVSGEMKERLRARPEFRFAARGVLSIPGTDSPVSAYDLEVELPARPVRPAAPPARRPRGPGRGVPRRWAALSAAIAVGLAVTMAFAWKRGGANPSSAAGFDPNRVAILYFSTSSPDPDLRARAKGLTEELIHQLSEVDALHVVPPSGVLPFRDKPVPSDSVARVLRAGTLLEGGLERAGDQLRLTLFLVDAASGERLRSKVLVARAGDPFALEEQLGRQSSRFLRWRLGRNLEVHARVSGTRNAAARALVLRAEQDREDARALLDAGDSLAQAAGRRLLGETDRLLMRAQAMDPRWGEVPVLRGWVAMERGAGLPPDAERRLTDTALVHADRALRLLPGEAQALELRGAVLWKQSHYDQPRDSAARLADAANRDLLAAVEADPRRVRAWNTLSQLRRVRGDHAGAYLATNRAVRFDPYLLREAEMRNRRMRVALSAGQFGMAREDCAAGARDFPTDSRFVECPLILLAYDDTRPPDPAAAETELARIEAADPSGGDPYIPVYRRMLYADVLARAGNADSARAVAARARGMVGGATESHGSHASEEAFLALCLGDRDAAVRWLQQLFRLLPQYRQLYANEYNFRSLRGDPALAPPVRRE